MNAWERLAASAAKPERLIVGLMSGTSVDGVDAALVRISGSGRATQVNVEAFVTVPFPTDLRRAVLTLSHGEGNAERVSRLSFELGGAFADAVETLLDRARVRPADLDAIASHGQTVSHTAPDATLQIGESAVLAQRLGVPVVSDFRTADVAAGGQGAPLVPYADWCLLTHPTHSRAIQNIGGIANVTYLPANATPEQVIGFDTGPGNMLIDRATIWVTGGAMNYDRAGQLAAGGEIDYDFLDWLLGHPFLEWSPPKSAGREEFGEGFFEEVRTLGPRRTDAALRLTLVATMTAFTALSIVDAYERFLPAMPDEIILGGGGAHNPTLVRMLADKIAPIPVRTHEAVGMNSDSKEAVAFALLANETLLGNASNLPSVTGASRRVIQGKVTLPAPSFDR